MNNLSVIKETKKKLANNYVAALTPYAVGYAIFFHIVLLMFLIGSSSMLARTEGGRIFLIVLSVIIGLALLCMLFVLSAPAEFGMLRFYARIYKNVEPENKEFIEGYKKNIFVKSVFLKAARFGIVFLFTLLLIVPGVIKAIEYSQAMFLLRNNMKSNPKKSTVSDSLKESSRIMKGHRKQYFMLQLRCLPWYLLCIPTFGIAYIFVAPYTNMLKMVFIKRVVTGDVSTGSIPEAVTKPMSPTDAAVTDTDNRVMADDSEIAPAGLLNLSDADMPQITGDTAYDEVPKAKKKSIADKIANPKLPVYDDFDKSPEQLRLERELLMLVETEENETAVEADKPVEITGQIIDTPAAETEQVVVEAVNYTDGINNEISEPEFEFENIDGFTDTVPDDDGLQNQPEILLEEESEIKYTDDTQSFHAAPESVNAKEDSVIPDIVAETVTEEQGVIVTETVTQTINKTADGVETVITETVTETVTAPKAVPAVEPETHKTPEHKPDPRSRLEELLAKRQALNKDKKE